MNKKTTKPASKKASAAAQMDSAPSVSEAKLRFPGQTTPDLDGLEFLDKEDLIATIKRMVNGGVSLSFHGKRTAMEIARRFARALRAGYRISMSERPRSRATTC